jgi:hypothetical protein
VKCSAALPAKSVPLVLIGPVLGVGRTAGTSVKRTSPIHHQPASPHSPPKTFQRQRLLTRRHFNTVLYTGTGSSNAVTGAGFQPDFVWIKGRSLATNHKLFDVVRGSNNAVNADETGAESADSNFVSIDSDGFTVTGDAAGSAINKTGDTFVAWCWKAGGTAVSNTDGSITSSVSVNTEAGFSIVSYTGTGATATIGHGLGVVPKWIIIKRRDSTGTWVVYDSYNGATGYSQLNASTAWGTDSGAFNNTSPTSSVFSVGNSAQTNASTATYVAYCFAEVEGFSSFGSYTGNGSTDGPIC